MTTHVIQRITLLLALLVSHPLLGQQQPMSGTATVTLSPSCSPADSASITQVVASADGSRLASLTWGGVVRIWGRTSGKLLGSWRVPDSTVIRTNLGDPTMAFAPDGDRLAIADLRGALREFSVAHPALRDIFEPTPPGTTRLHYRPFVAFHQLRMDSSLAGFGAGLIRGWAYIEGGKTLVVDAGWGWLKWWSIEREVQADSTRLVYPVDSPSGLGPMGWDSVNQQLIVTFRDGFTRAFDPATWQPRWAWASGQQLPRALSLFGDSFATLWVGGVLTIAYQRTGQEQCRTSTLPGAIGATPSPAGRYLAVYDYVNVQVIDVATCGSTQARRTANSFLIGVWFDDNCSIMSAYRSGDLKLIPLPTPLVGPC